MRTKSPGPGISFLRYFLVVTLTFAVVQVSGIQETRAQTPKRALKQLSAGVAQWPRTSKRFALVIGVDEYIDTQINKLEGAGNDAKALASVLTDYAGFPRDQVILLASDQPLERRPTFGNILRRLSNLRAIVPKDGLLLFAFAGHGIERRGQAYLLPSDAQVSEDIGLLERTAINVTDISDWIRGSAVAQVVLILDACRSDPVAGRSDGDNLLTEAYTRGLSFEDLNRDITAFATLYATAVGHRAYEYKEKKQGYFTWALVEGLKGGAANERGEITLSALVEYVQEQVPKRIRMDLGEGKLQHPFAEIGGYRANDLIVAAVPRTSPTSSETAQLAKPLDPVRIELSFWETIKNSTDPEDFSAYLEKYPTGEFAVLARLRAAAHSKPSGETGGANKGSKDLTTTPNTSEGSNNTASVFAPARTRSVDVIGKRDWTSAGLIVKRGDHIRVTASGSITLDPVSGRSSGPEGLGDLPDAKKLMPDQPTGALIGVISSDNDDFIFIGRAGEFTATRDGLLFLSVNEGQLSDNVGSFKAVVEVLSQRK